MAASLKVPGLAKLRVDVRHAAQSRCRFAEQICALSLSAS